MILRIPLTLFSVICVFVGPMILAQQPKQNLAKVPAWDLSYTSLLKENKIDPEQFLARWLKETDRSFTSKLLAGWQGEPITASVLIEIPAPHAAEHVVCWLFRTEKKAYYWEAIDTHHRQPVKKEVDAKSADDALRRFSSLKQARLTPVNDPKMDEAARKALSGYLGFFNYFDKQGSRQMLLVHDDFLEKPYRVLSVLEPLRK